MCVQQQAPCRCGENAQWIVPCSVRHTAPTDDCRHIPIAYDYEVGECSRCKPSNDSERSVLEENEGKDDPEGYKTRPSVKKREGVETTYLLTRFGEPDEEEAIDMAWECMRLAQRELEEKEEELAVMEMAGPENDVKTEEEGGTHAVDKIVGTRSLAIRKLRGLLDEPTP